MTSQLGRNIYRVIGLMSGTSLDGLDIAFCEFAFEDGKWSFEICKNETVFYSEKWKTALEEAPHYSKENLAKLNEEYGHYLGLQTAEFIKNNQLNIDLVASHGHTVFHQPSKGITYQIGDGQALRSHISCPLVNDFRAPDVKLGGQGAPLVPIGDQLLFSNYEACINIGGFANISTLDKGKRVAWDICPANILMNPIAELLGSSYDENGKWARQGVVDEALLEKLNGLKYYMESPPKSLGKEWVEEVILPLIEKASLQPKDLLRTLLEHISEQIALDLDGIYGPFLFTGGGVQNSFLMERIQAKTSAKISVPTKTLIDFKEALIFAFMGLLRWKGEDNILASVTGVDHNHSSGTIIS
jgi:anhydro-N-acetylmuramic acid kinase